MAGSDAIHDTRNALLEEGVVLCVRLDGDAPLVDACRAALAGGLRVLEVTLTTPGALAAIERLAAEGEALVGAGTVLSIEDVQRVADSGGRFVFSPVFDPEVVARAHALGLLAVPGAATPAEILSAHRHGADPIKVFPSGALGGPAYLRAIRGPLPHVRLLPTSGPDSSSAADYFHAGAAAIGVGNEVLPPGFTLESVEAAARRVRRVVDAARGGRPPEAVDVPTEPRSSVGVQAISLQRGLAHGVTCTWEGGQYVALIAPRGVVACGILDPEVCERFGFAVALAHGTPEQPLVIAEDVLSATVDTVSSAARALGVEPGMKGEDALSRLFD